MGKYWPFGPNIPPDTSMWPEIPRCVDHGSIMSWVAKHGDSKGFWYCTTCAMVAKVAKPTK